MQWSISQDFLKSCLCLYGWLTDFVSQQSASHLSSRSHAFLGTPPDTILRDTALQSNRAIPVYNVCLISISNSVSGGAKNNSVLNIERSWYDYSLPLNMRLMHQTLFLQHGFKSSKFWKKCMSSLALLPPRNCAVFEVNFALNIPPKELKHSLCTFARSVTGWSQLRSSMFPSIQWAKILTVTSATIPL